MESVKQIMALWQEKNNIDLLKNLLNESGEISVTQESDSLYYLNFTVFKKKKEENIYSIPISETGEILDPLYNINLNPDPEQSYPKISQYVTNNSVGYGLRNLKLTEKTGKDVFFTLSPLDNLFFRAMGEKNVVTITPDVFDNIENSNFFKELNEQIEIQDVNKYYLCFPDIPEKERFEEVVAKRLDKYKTVKMNVESLRDYVDFEPSSFFQYFEPLSRKIAEKVLIPEFILNTFKEESESFPVSGIYQFKDFESKVDSIYKNGVMYGAETGWGSLDKIFRPKTKHVTVVYGMPISGKSLFVKNLCINLARTSNWKTAFYTFEDESGESFYHEMIEKITGTLTPFYGTAQAKRRNMETLKEPKYLEAKRLIQNNFKLVLPNYEDYKNENFLETLLGLFEKAISIYGVKNIVIDPWNQVFTGKPQHLSESEFLNLCLGRVNQFAKKHDVHVFIVTHPKQQPKEHNGEYKVPTLYDINGGAQWFNKISVGICIHRNVQAIKNQLDKILNVYVQKRKDRTLGNLGSVFLVTGTGNETLIDGVDQEAYERHINSENKEKKVNLGQFLKMTGSGEILNQQAMKVTHIDNTNGLFASGGEVKKALNIKNDSKDGEKPTVDNSKLPF